MNPKFSGAVALAGLFVTGCMFPSTGRMVSRQQVGHMQRVEWGTVQKVNDVVVEGERGPIGIWGGAAMGAAAAGESTHGVSHDLARASGAVVGAATGQAVEEAITRKPAKEMLIRLENGDLVLVTEVSPPVVAVGDRVGVADGGGAARIVLP